LRKSKTFEKKIMVSLQFGQEEIPEDEQEATRAITAISERLLNQKLPVRRGEHPKAHGCMRGELVIDADLPNDKLLRVGVFQEPGKRFPACIRFSNFSQKDDRKGDAHGMAIKLFAVPGEKLLEDEKYEQTQDFLLIDHPVFVVRNARDYVEFFAEIERGGSRNPIKFFIPSLNPLQWRWREMLIGIAIRLTKITSPLTTQYWSTTPYQLGDRAIKFSVKPALDHQPNIWQRLSRNENYLYEVMKAHFQSKMARFDFLIQFQRDSDTMPIEDPTIEWHSPYHKVATLTILPQIFDTPAQQEFCENLSYTPWHALPEHRPLGGINRPRKQVYELISRLRNQLNGVPHQEPTIEEFFDIFKGRE
jgi:Catalase